MQWFRLHTEFAHDPKLNSFTKAQRYDLVVLLCLAADSHTPGTIFLDDEDIAATLQLTEEEFVAFVSKLEKKNILARDEKENLTFINWKDRQYEKDSDTPEATRDRKRRQREREKEQSESVTLSHANVTPMSRPVTLPEQSRAEQSRYITEQSRAEQNGAIVTAGVSEAPALPACPPSVASNGLPAPPASARENCADVLTEAEFKDLVASGWNEREIVTGCQILRERPKKPNSPKGLLHSAILPEVRLNGKVPSAANSPPKVKPPATTPEDRAAFQAKKAAEMAALRARREAKNGYATLPE